MNTWKKISIVSFVLGVLGIAYWKLAIPTHRVEIRSELVMLGDVDADRHWTANDLKIVEGALRTPFALSDDLAWRLDVHSALRKFIKMEFPAGNFVSRVLLARIFGVDQALCFGLPHSK